MTHTAWHDLANTHKLSYMGMSFSQPLEPLAATNQTLSTTNQPNQRQEHNRSKVEDHRLEPTPPIQLNLQQPHSTNKTRPPKLVANYNSGLLLGDYLLQPIIAYQQLKKRKRTPVAAFACLPNKRPCCQTLQDLPAYPKPVPLPPSLSLLSSFHRQSRHLLQASGQQPTATWLFVNNFKQQQRHWELINWAHYHPSQIRALDSWLQFAYQQHIGKKELYHLEQVANIYRVFFELHCAVFLASQALSNCTILLDGDAEQARKGAPQRQASFDFSLYTEPSKRQPVRQYWEITSIGAPLHTLHQMKRPLRHILRKSLTILPEQACALAIAMHTHNWRTTNVVIEQMLGKMNNCRPIRQATITQQCATESIDYWQWASSRLDRVLLFAVHQPQLAPIVDLERLPTGQWQIKKRPAAPCQAESASL